MFEDECGCASLKCSTAAGNGASNVAASHRAMRATSSRLKQSLANVVVTLCPDSHLIFSPSEHPRGSLRASR